MIRANTAVLPNLWSGINCPTLPRDYETDFIVDVDGVVRLTDRRKAIEARNSEFDFRQQADFMVDADDMARRADERKAVDTRDNKCDFCQQADFIVDVDGVVRLTDRRKAIDARNSKSRPLPKNSGRNDYRQKADFNVHTDDQVCRTDKRKVIDARNSECDNLFENFFSQAKRPNAVPKKRKKLRQLVNLLVCWFCSFLG